MANKRCHCKWEPWGTVNGVEIFYCKKCQVYKFVDKLQKQIKYYKVGSEKPYRTMKIK